MAIIRLIEFKHTFFELKSISTLFILILVKIEKNQALHNKLKCPNKKSSYKSYNTTIPIFKVLNNNVDCCCIDFGNLLCYNYYRNSSVFTSEECNYRYCIYSR